MDSSKICRQLEDHLPYACLHNLKLRFLIMQKKRKVCVNLVFLKWNNLDLADFTLKDSGFFN